MSMWEGLKNQLYKGIIPSLVGGILFIMAACSPAPAAPQPAPTPEPPVIQTPTQTPVQQEYVVKGAAYHDYNGDGMKEEDEPIIAGLELSFSEDNSKINNVKTNENGIYEITLPEGEYKLEIGNNVLGYNDQPFRYVSKSEEKFYHIESVPVIGSFPNIKINENLSYDIKLMQGFLTLPFSSDIKINIKDYFDVGYDPTPFYRKLLIRVFLALLAYSTGLKYCNELCGLLSL